MIEIDVSEEVDFDHAGVLWKELESRADNSFFQSWAWVGCLAAQRFSRPVLLQAREDDITIALGLFNHRRRFGGSELLLNESGTPEYDAVFVEHNGFLIEQGRSRALLAACLERVLTARIGRLRRHKPRRLVLGGVPALYLAAEEGGRYRAVIRARRSAPFVDLLALRAEGEEYLARLSANTRYQLKRSRRRYAAEGPLTLTRAGSAEEALDFLARLADLHQRYWIGRGKPGAFAGAGFQRFHQALIERAFPSGGIDLLRIGCGERAIGYLYNFRYKGSVSAYQSGFDYGAAGIHQKPGLTCHNLAIEHYLANGAIRYDFLAGDDRYKLSLATGTLPLYWLAAKRPRRLSVAQGRLIWRFR